MVIPLVAVYANGGAPRRRPVKNVNRSGAWIETPDRWYPGTIVSMMFQYDPHYLQVARIAGDPAASIRMRAKVLRTEPAGIAVRFVYVDPQERGRFQKLLAGSEVRGAQ